MLRHLHGRWTGTSAFAVGVIVMLLGSGYGWVLALGAAIAAAGAAFTIADALKASRLSDAYRTFAEAQGWEYLTSTPEYGGRFSAYPFASGIRRRQESVVRGEFGGIRCATFAHVYEERTDRDLDTAVTVAHQVTLAELPVRLPRIDIVPEGVSTTVMRALGGTDVDVESHEFNKLWRVKASDARYAHAVLDARMIERLLAFDARGTAVRIEGAAVYTWSLGRKEVDGLARRLALVAGIARRIPAHVLREYREQGLGMRDGMPESAPSWATEPGALTTRRPTELAAQAGWSPLGVEPPSRGGRAVPPVSPKASIADAREAHAPTPPMTGPAWATEAGALTRRRYTGVGVDADGDGIEDWKQMPRDEAPPRALA
ncbi:hypothetical protein [Demequina sp.]|uniref:hypothetical protein n=1 Tax=Demequina sp. TaxID=2050685 RepID=UPI003A87A004